MRSFVGVVHHDPGSAYGVSFPDVPGCFAAADSFEEVVAAGVEALTLWFEDRPAVEPGDIERIRAAAAADLAAGAVLVMVPYVRPATRTVRANLSFDAGVLAAIDAEARRRKLTRSAFLADAALNELQGRH